MESNYIDINRKLWNDKTKVHIHSAFYDVETFRKTKNSLNDIELVALGDVTEKSLLHLQCHFGMDSLSWANKGAIVTGVDFSDEAIKEAKKLSADLNLPTDFICSDVYDLKQHLDKKFDIIFTSYGTIGWLPDLDKWANIIQHFLKPGGVFYMVDFHPVLWMMDSDFSKMEFSYFNLEPIIEETEGTYADRTAEIKNKSIGWNHPLCEIMQALLKKGLQISDFNEFDYSNYPCFNNLVEIEKGKWMIKGLEKIMPVMYSIKATL